jgi:hypothetical protein
VYIYSIIVSIFVIHIRERGGQITPVHLIQVCNTIIDTLILTNYTNNAY